MSTPLRTLAIKLLDDDRGINIEAWTLLQEMLRNDPCANDDIIDFVESTDGWYYLPESAMFILDAKQP
jgi:hypothetical protein